MPPSSILRAPAPLLSLLATLLLLPPHTTANPHPLASARAGFSYDELFARWDCTGELCGWNDQLCCESGSACYTDSSNQAQCSATAAVGGGSGGGYWEVFTTTYTLTDLQTITSTGSYQAQASASGTARCNYALAETPCGDVCCASDQYCQYAGQCVQNSLGSTLTSAGGATYVGGGGIATVTGVAGPPILGTSSGNILTTATVSPTTTVPYQTPVATGANITMTEQNGGGGGLSGGAIAGIVIGVLLGLALLGLLCFCCCIKGLLDGCLALFGIGGRKKKRRTEVEEYERRTHHSSRGNGRTWYGAAKPSRVDRRDRRENESHKGRNAAGLLGGLGALWAVLGLKRHHNEKKQSEKYNQSEYSYTDSSYLGTSESSASSDRRTRYSRAPPRSMARSQSRR